MLLLGFTFVAGNAVYVTASEYFCAKAHRDFLLAERRRALWEFKHFKEQEVKAVRILIAISIFFKVLTLQMELRFINKGMHRKDAEVIVQKLSAYENIFVAFMVSVWFEIL